MNDTAIDIRSLRHTYGERIALDDVSFQVQRGSIFGLLGPNGGGKTTLFKILSTLLTPSGGNAAIFGEDLGLAQDAVRRHLGVVFQHPSLDEKLSVMENLECHGFLYGMHGSRLQERARSVMQQLGLAERCGERVESLSGGLQRRVELAKALLHQPALLLLDEPSTGLDPGARRDFMQHLHQLRNDAGTTIVLTTHYMEEAERCDRVALLHRGRLVRVDTPSALKTEVGGDILVLQASDGEGLRAKIKERFGCAARIVDGTLRLEHARGHELLRDLVEAFPDDITHVTFGKPTLEDVFIHLTGHRFWADAASTEEEV